MNQRLCVIVRLAPVPLFVTVNIPFCLLIINFFFHENKTPPSKPDVVTYLSCHCNRNIGASPEPCVLSQIPQGLNYQAIARDGSGNPITSATMQVKIGILSDTIANIMVWEKLFNPVKTNAFGMFNIVVGTGVKQSGSAATFSAIDWTKTPLFLRTSIYYPSSWKVMGTSKLQSVPYSMVAANLEGSVPLLSVKGNTTTMDSALFVVRNNTGQIVFAVYNEGVRIYVDNGVAKGATKGGFAIGSFDKSKGTTQPLFVVDPDSIRAYLDNNPVKAIKGGFAIGGFDRSKSSNQNFLSVSKDSIRMYIDDNLTSKSTKGGFAIGSFDKSKGGNTNFFNVFPDSTGKVYPSENRILWYPLKDALLEGRVIAENKDSVGEYSFASGFESRSKGKYSQALGYKAIARGDYSTAIGKNAVANKINSFAFGDSARATNAESYAIGRGALASGYRSFAFGSAGIDTAGKKTDNTYAKGDYSFAIGQGAYSGGKVSFALGLADSALGNYSYALGYKTVAKGNASLSVGYSTTASGGSSFATGKSTIADGWGSTAMGYQDTAKGSVSIAIGQQTKALAWCSTSTGFATTASGDASLATGRGTIATGENTASFGYCTYARAFSSVSLGRYNVISGDSLNWVDTDPLFIVGNGTADNNRLNAVTVLKNGRVGIGTTNPTKRLHVEGGAYTKDGLQIGNSAGMITQNWWEFGMDDGVSGAGIDFHCNSTPPPTNDYSARIYRAPGNNGDFNIWNAGTGNLVLHASSGGITVNNNGNIGIGTNSAGFLLEVNGSAGKPGGGSWSTSSDLRLKDIHGTYKKGLKDIIELNPVLFNYKKDNPKNLPSAPEYIGFVAQDVQAIFPEAITESKDGYLDFNMHPVNVALVNAVKELNQQIESTRQENQKLRSEIEELKALVNTLVANQTGQGNK